MAEDEARQSPVLLPFEQHDGDSDNESVGSNEPDNTQKFSRLENELKDEMGSIASQVKETILSMEEQMQQKFTEFDRQIQNIQMHLRNQNNNQDISQVRNSTPMQLNADRNMQTCNIPNTRSVISTDNTNNQQAQATVEFSLHGASSNSDASASSTSQTRPNNYERLKPQTYTGSDDFEDFLTQFEITSEINGWDYKARSLYLANSLTGAARALLNELNAEQRRDYKSLVQKLTERYGSENRAEVFRSQLKSRVKGKGETTAELAQSVRKLTRQAYPKVSLDVVEALAVDHFIDALPETEIRLRLREVGPTTLAEAEKIAVRMEAHRIADKHRTRLVGKVEQEGQGHLTSGQNTIEQRMANISKSIDTLQKSVQNLANQRNSHTQAHFRNYQPNNVNNNQRQNRLYDNQRQNRNWNPRNFPPRGGNPGNNYQNNVHAHAQRNQVRPQENMRQSDQGSGFRLN